MTVKLAVPKEIQPGERRVAITPDVAKKLIKDGLDVVVETNAGLESGFRDADYQAVGAKIAGSAKETYAGANIVLKLNKLQKMPDGTDELSLLDAGTLYISFLAPLFEPRRMKEIAERKVLSFSMDAVPRTSRAQTMDALSSQANIAGYKAVLMAADRLPKLMPMLMTAAGTISPAKVFVLGAGVAGLQAIATARRLGAVVSAFDVRSAVKEQVKSLGSKFVEIDVGESGEGEGGYARELSEAAKQVQRDKLGEVAKDMDIIITTAAIPGRQAPRLIEKNAVEKMRSGSIIVDLAASTGGNVEGALPDQEVNVNGVFILGPTNLAAAMPKDASQMYAKNVTALLGLMIKDKAIAIDWDDDILAASVITRDGEIVHAKTKELVAKL
jgi:NAD(P) transhydrogenase subunit alpha